VRAQRELLVDSGITIVNESRGAVIADKVEVAASFWSRGKGLIGRKSLAEGYGLVIRPCGSIHMFFMSVPLDVLHVDKDGRIIRILHEIKPWRVGPIVFKSKWVVELPAGTARRSGTEEGDVVAVVGEHRAADNRQMAEDKTRNVA
jgi:uncharacterized membrane protein (UPF0127 family)